jgi:hypothetical protein
MNKLVAIVTTTLCALLCCTSNAHAQGTLPRIGVRKWTIESPQVYLSTALAYARDADRLFVGTWAGTILVVDTKVGQVVDTIKTSDYPEIWNQMKDRPVQIIRYLSATDDGDIIVFGFEFLSRTIMVAYPTKRMLDSVEMSIGSNVYRRPSNVQISPRGTFVYMEDVIINRRNGMRWNVPFQLYRISFDTSETVAAYNDIANYDGKSYIQFVSVQFLDDTARKPIQTNLWGIPTVSADGQKLMTAGAAWAIDRISPDLPSRAVVMNLNDGSVVWQIQGDRDSPDPYDFDEFAWNNNGTMFFGKRNSPSLKVDDRYRLFRWTVGSPSPNAFVDTRLVNGNGFFPIFNPEMSEAYTTSNQNEIHCYDVTQLVSSVIDSRKEQFDTVYPNPTTGIVTIISNALASAWRLTSMYGHVITTGSQPEITEAGDGKRTFQIEIPTEIAPGSYVLSTMSATNEVLSTVIVVKQ